MSSLPPEIVVVLEPPLPDVVVTVEPPLPDVVVTVSEVGLVGPAGPRGPAGPPGDSTGTAGPAGRTTPVALSGHRLVVPESGGTVTVADYRDLSSLSKPVWLTTGAATAGAAVPLLAFGMLVEPSWAWTQGPLFVGIDGLLTQTAPTTGYVRQVATAMDPTTVWFDPQPALVLA